MLTAFAWGLIASSSLLLVGWLGLKFSFGKRTLGIVMAFCAGTLISAIAEAYNHGGKLAGVFTVLGFAMSVTVALLEAA